MIKPNFFIIGAPKCGTTALSEYLRGHPRIGFSIPKEPVYFCTDFPRVLNFSTDAEYLGACFSHCQGRNLIAIGEGSTSYFFSVEAVPNILAFQPEAKFIVMLRNPIEMVPAVHAQKLLDLDEDQSDFEKAWFLQEARIKGNGMPKRCLEPELLHYANIGRLGTHLARILTQVPEGQIKVIVFDDFVKDTAAVYCEVLAFLGVPRDIQAQFPKINERMQIRIPSLYAFSQRPPNGLMRWVNYGKKLIGVERLNISSKLSAWNLRRSDGKPISSKMRKILLAEFGNDIDLLASLLNRDLSHWKN